MNFSGEEAGPYAVVVIRSWRRAQERLRWEVLSGGNRGARGGVGNEGLVYNEAYMPPTQISR